MTRPAFAAERRHVLSIDISCLAAGHSAANPPHAAAAAVDRWDRQTDRRTLDRFIESAAYTVQEVSIKM